MKLSTFLPYAGRPVDAVAAVVALEGVGLDTVWVPEVYGFDAPTLMGYLAARTSTVAIGSAILNVYSRTPALIAQTAAGLDHVSGGRAILGLGTSGPQVVEGWHGVPFDAPIARTREVAAIVRLALRREELISDSGHYRLPLPPGQGTGLGKPLRMLTRPERPAIPIYVAALSPTSVRAVAEYADGWIPFLFMPEHADAVWGEALRAGAARRPADLGTLEVVAGGLLAIGDDVDRMLDAARPSAALYIGGMGARGRNFYNDLVVRYGFAHAAKAIQDAYLAGRTKAAEALVPTELLAGTNLVGTAAQVRSRLDAYRAAGVTNLSVTPIGDDPIAQVATVRRWLDEG